VNRTTQLASALLALGHIPYEDSKRMTAAQIISLYQWDHFPIRKADGGPDEPWNLVPRLIAAHREKTAKVDMPAMSKDRAIGVAEVLHVQRMVAKAAGEPRPARRHSWWRR
jgi:hypothetical protein